MRRQSTILAAVAGAVVLAIVGVASSGVEWNECRTCGVQRYDRTLFGVRVEALSESEYDEYGTYAAWRSIHGWKCTHQFTPVDRSKGPAAASRAPR